MKSIIEISSPFLDYKIQSESKDDLKIKSTRENRVDLAKGNYVKCQDLTPQLHAC